VNGTLLAIVRCFVATVTYPLVVPVGTLVVTPELDTTLKVATVPLELTLNPSKASFCLHRKAARGSL
jgi:hypothetical protein